CRRPDAADALQELREQRAPIELVACDCGDEAAIAQAADAIAARSDRVHTLINNAGRVGEADDLDRLDPAGLLDCLRVNLCGPLLLTRALRPLLARGAGRVLLLTSRTAVLFEQAGHGAGGGYGYATSKAALHRAIPQLAADLAPDGITVIGCNPGFVATDMTAGSGPGRSKLSPEESAAALLDGAAAVPPERTGAFIDWRGCPSRWLAPPESAADRQIAE
ncbi:MAG: SDR family NAD(P)-dependent oxidoreductase, partial [Planctomycetota bacterium]